MVYSRRVAAWLSALPVHLVALCGGHSKLEMISFWLLCWKLLRATSGVKRIKGRDPTDDPCEDGESQQHTPQHAIGAPHTPHPPPNTPSTPHTPQNSDEAHSERHPLSQSIAMETSSSTDLIACWAEMQDFEKESYPGGLGAEEEEEQEPGDGPIVEEEGKEEEGLEERRRGDLAELLRSSSLVVGEEEEEEEEEEKEGEEPVYKVEDLVSEDADESSAHSEVAGDPEPRTMSVLEQRIRDEVVSNASTGSGHDPDRDPDDLSDCLQVEMAVVSSDSDVDDQWKASVTGGHKEEKGVEEIQDGADPPVLLEHPESPPPACQLQTSSPPAPSLSLIPEDEEGGQGNPSTRPPVLRSPSTCSSSASDLDRKIPLDYCVLQENVSENVSVEHVDFLGAREQWRQMEEQVKGQGAAGQLLPQTGVRAEPGVGCQGGHSFLYSPVRNIDRPRRETESETQGLGGEGLLHSTFSPCSEDSGVDELSGRSLYEAPENQVEREIRLTLEREENFRRERRCGPARARPSTLHPHPHPGDRRRGSPSPCTPTFSISPSPSSPSRPVYHEMSANNVIILEPDSSSFAANPRQRPHGLPLLSPGHAPCFNDWSPSADPSSVIILETSNLIIRSASEFCLSSAGAGGRGETVQESTFSSNPFFKLRSRSSMSLVEQEIRAVRQREEEWRRQRAQLQVGGARERYDTVLVSPNLLEGLSYDQNEVPVRCVSSPSSPSRTRKLDRSTLSCDHRFPASLSCSASSPSFTVSRRQNAMAQRWEASLLANHSKD